MAKRGNPGTPYTPGVDGGGTKPGRGNPGTPYTPPYKKDEKPTTENRGDPYTPGVNGGGTGSGSTAPTPAPTPQPSTSSSSSDDEHKQQNQNPFYNPGFQQQQQSQSSSSDSSEHTQQNSNEAFLNTLQANNVTNLAKNTTSAQKFNVQTYKPSPVKAILEKESKKRAEEVKKNLDTTNEKEINARNLDKYADEMYWVNGRKQDVSYATSIDYYNMSRRGYKTVYVEDGTGALSKDKGVYTIGRDNLAGIPSGVNTVLVDNEGNWKYLADTTSRANHVEALQDKVTALNKNFENNIKDDIKLRDTAKNSLLYKETIFRMTVQEKGIKDINDITDPEVLMELNNLKGSIDSYNAIINDCNNRIQANGKAWAERYEHYNTAINNTTKWSVEDEEKFQDLKADMLLGKVDDPTTISYYIQLSKRREENQNCAAFLSSDYVNKLKQDEAYMKKAIDEYNRWDWCTVHLEKGEDLGNQIKRLMAINLGYDPDADNLSNLINVTANTYKTIKSGSSMHLLGRLSDESYRKNAKDVLGKSYEAVEKYGRAYNVAKADYDKAANAYYDIQRRIANGDYKNEDELAALYAKRLDLYRASENAVSQCKSIFFNNTVSNLTVFDTASVQSTFVAWRMASHPERYENDIKWLRMQEAFEAIYGTAWRDDSDAGKMAMAMLNMKLGKSELKDRYIYLDGSDLRHSYKDANDEYTKYGLGAALAVGMLTDISALAGLGKAAAGAATRIAGAKAITKAASDSYIQALVRAEVPQAIAEQFVHSRAIQRAIYKDVKKAIGKTVKEQGDDVSKLIRDVLTDRSKTFKGAFVKDIGASVDDTLKVAREVNTESALLKGKKLIINDVSDAIDNARYLEFLDNAKASISASGDITKIALRVEKGTMLTHALGSLDDALNDMQSTLFKVTCPAAGAVVGIAKANKAVRELRNLRLANEQELFRITVTNQLVQSKVAAMAFDDVLDGTNFYRKCRDILDEWADGVMGANKEDTMRAMEHAQLFSQYQDNIMREVSNSYTSRVINDLDRTLSREGIAGLENLAAEKGFQSFDEMYDTIRTNLSVMYAHSPDARGIVAAFDSTYRDAVTAININNVKTYVDHAKDHVEYIKSVLNTKGKPIISETNAVMYPEFVQGNAKTAMDNIRDFMRTTNIDYTKYVDADGVIHYIHESAKDAIDALENITLGGLDELSIKYAQDALAKYYDDIDNVYLKQLKDWEADTIQDVLGVQTYFDNINHIVPEHSGNREILNSVADGMQKFFEEKGIDISKQEIMDNILKENPNDFLKLSDKQQQAVIYRIMENKGSNVIGQISDENLRIVTDELNDCNSQLNKTLRLLQLEMEDGTAAKDYITQAITNGVAVSNSRMIYNALKAEGVDSTMCLAVMDAMSGNANYINSLVQSCPPDIAAAKIRDCIIDEAKKQFSLHNGSYSLYTNLGCNGVDVSSNVLKIEEQLAEHIPEEEQYLDICVSMVKSTDGTAPKDIAFHVRGAEDAPTVLRKEGKFSIYDDNFARRTFGNTAENLNKDYEALGDLETLSDDEWINKFQDYINKQKQIALDHNKTIRLIGFNTSDAVSGGNRFLSDTLRSAGVNANTANALDLADIIRAKNGEYVFNTKDIDAITRCVQNAAYSANSKSISLGVRKVIAYDPKYTCVDMLNNALKNTRFDSAVLNENTQYILENLKVVSKGLGTEAYNDLGQAMGTYINATAFQKVLQDTGLTDISANGNIMRIVTEATVNGETQLGLHKIIEDAMDDQWIDKSKLTKKFTLNTFNDIERMHDSILQINRINNSIRRTDLITDADIPGLKRILHDLKTKTGMSHYNAHAYAVLQSLKVDELSAQQLYSASKWLLGEAKKIMKPEKYDEFFAILLANNRNQMSKLTDVGYKFIRDNIVDYTSDSLDAFFVKYLDTSEEGYKFAQALNDLAELKRTANNTKSYMDAVEGLFKRYEVHGVQDRMILYQLADVHSPIINLHDEMKHIYEHAKYAAQQRLEEEAAMFTIRKGDSVRGGRYSRDMINRISTEEGVRAAKAHIIELGEDTRASAVQCVANLDEEAFKAHLVRNCCGGMVIDPSAACMRNVDLVQLFDKWSTFKGIKIDSFNFTQGVIKDRKLFRVSFTDLNNANMDEVFAKYNHATVQFHNPYANRFGKSGDVYTRHMSFGASDMTLINANHVDAFRNTFFVDAETGDSLGTILDLNKNFKSWSNELYCCNMWTDMDLKQLVNPYYTDNMLNNLAQTTHQLRNNISAVHDFGTIVNNRYMNTAYILNASGVYKPYQPIAEQRKNIVAQLKNSNQRLCTLALDKNNHFRVVDYTPRILNKKTDDKFFKSILENTIMLDEGMVNELSDWTKSTSIALKLQGYGPVKDFLSTAYNIYKKTIRSATVTMYLYGNLGTAVRNYVDSSTKGANEIMQYNESVFSYLKHYKDALATVHDYSNIYRQIENDLGTVNRETVAKFFEGNKEGLDKFNLLYGYEHTCGGDSLIRDVSLAEVRNKNIEYIRDGINIDKDTADAVRKAFDDVYGSSKYYGMTNAQLEKHMVDIHKRSMELVEKRLGKKLNDTDLAAISEKFWDYHPTVTSWGDRMAEFPVLNFNRERFNNAEVRARLAIYQTFIEGGASEVEAMKHVTATQFNYAGLGKVEDFMPFTQYKLYNALYWFDHANARSVSTAWRAAQYNGDGSMTNQEISDLISSYRQKSYYIYDAGKDAAYDDYFKNNLEELGQSLFDANNYLGLPREFSSGNIDLNGTHYLKLGNSFVEELDLVTTCMAGAALFASTMKDTFSKDNTADTESKIRMAYESFKFTPLYDSVYSPWKSYIDLAVYTYDHKEMIAKRKGKSIENYEISTADIFDCYQDYFLDKNTSKQAWSGIPVVGAILSNMSTRWKNFELNQGLLAALVIDPDAKKELYTYTKDLLCDMTGMVIPSVVGTKVEVEKNRYDYYRDSLSKILVQSPGTYFDITARLLALSGELQREGFTEEQVKDIANTISDMLYKSPHSELASGRKWFGDMGKRDYFNVMKELYSEGYDPEEILNLFKQNKLPEKEFNRFREFTAMLPNYLKYDKVKRSELINYYKAMGMTADQYWARMINSPAIIIDGKLVELNHSQVLEYNKKQELTHNAIKKQSGLTQEEWDAYWDSLSFRYPKGKWSEAYAFLKNAGYSEAAAREMLLHGYMLDENGMLVDVPGKARAHAYSSRTYVRDAAWDAYWNSIPDYTKYEKGAFGRTMKALKKQGYSDAEAKALIQQGIYVDKNGNMMNVAGMERPVLGFPNFNAYYQSIPDYCKYEKGAFKRTYAALKALGFDYETSLRLIQQGAYLMDMSMAPSLFQTLGARRNKDGSAIAVVDLNTLLARYGGQAIIGADGKPYMLVDCSGLTRPRKTYSYSRRGRGGGRSGRSYSKGGRGKKFRGYGGRGGRREYTPKPPKIRQFTLRKPFLLNGNVSTFSGMTNFRGSNKLGKPYTTKGYVSTYSSQNFLNGSSYGMRKTYKIDMRQFKSGALSTKSAYPTSYRNIAVAYRRNMYKDLYAKYGMSRMRMRANKQGYSNAAITRLRRNEIQNRERYDERRDQITKTKIKKKASN